MEKYWIYGYYNDDNPFFMGNSNKISHKEARKAISKKLTSQIFQGKKISKNEYIFLTRYATVKISFESKKKDC